jgi:hypothetical protein
MSDHFIGVYDNLASHTYCDKMTAKLDELINLSSSSDKGENTNGGLRNRKDIARYFERDCVELANETNTILNSGLDLYREKYPSVGMINFYSQVVKVQKTYPKGGFHLWHSEQGEHQNASRCLVWMIYLNDTLIGEGETEFLEQGIKIQPKKGTVVFFPAAWTHTHRGNPVYNCTKYIATGWYYLNGA